MTIFERVNDLIRNPSLQEEFANRAFAAYCAAKREPTPAPFTKVSDDLNFRLNQLGLIAAAAIATQMALPTTEEAEPSSKEDSYAEAFVALANPETYLNTDALVFIETAMHGIWMGCQAGRGSARFEHKDYVPYELLDKETARLDSIQVREAAVFIVEKLELGLVTA